MTRKKFYTQKGIEGESPSFQTLNMTMQDKSYQSSRYNIFKVFLGFLKRIHWFTLLLLLILGWSGYQVVMRSPSKYPVVQEAIYKIKTWVDSIKQPSVSTLDPQVKENREPKHVAAFKAAQPISPAAEPIPVRPSKDHALKEDANEMKALEKRLVYMENSIKQLNLQMAALQRNARTLDHKVRRFSQSMHTTPKPYAGATPVQTNASPPQTDKTPPADPKPAQPNAKKKEEYSLHAIIPGRAWLNTPEGKIITVSLGSPLPPHGTVHFIDSEQHIVYCSTGTLIKFSTQDY
jgi:Tfp pilus assembly protein FimV